MENYETSSYAAAGVNVEAGYESVKRIIPLINSTARQGVLGGIGGFSGFFEPNLSAMKRPVAVSGTDGVGTKLKIAFLMDKHDTIGIDCVAMCVNDIICTGAEPLFFLDYLAMGKNDPAKTERIVAGIAEGCRQAGCALIGGETAEHPGMMPDDEYDVAGFAVGFIDHDRIIDGKTVLPGDAIIGLASSGLHSNGYSLIRRILAPTPGGLEEYIPDFACTLGEELLRPTRIYVAAVLRLIAEFSGDVKGICHITGGGYNENIPRMLPVGVRARIETSKIARQPVFRYISDRGNIDAVDMYGTFNMGIGVALAVSAGKCDAIVSFLRAQGETPAIIGQCVSGEKGVDLFW